MLRLLINKKFSRTIALAIFALSLSACAIFNSGTSSTANAKGAAEARDPAYGETNINVERVSFTRAAPALRVSHPVALAPCANGDPLTKNCRRAGDEHFVFESPVPDNVAFVPPRPPAPMIADGQ